MQTTAALDDELVSKAQAFTGFTERSSLAREALKALIERESALRFVAWAVQKQRLLPILAAVERM